MNRRIDRLVVDAGLEIARLDRYAMPDTPRMLGEMYRASAHGLNELIATVSPTARALLAVYCYRCAHLASIGLAIAATCEKDDLTSLGGNAGTMLFERSREAPQSSLTDARANGRRTITLPAADFACSAGVLFPVRRSGAQPRLVPNWCGN